MSAAHQPLPDFYKQMLERKWLGDKTKGGFYKKSERALRAAKKKNGSPWIGRRSNTVRGKKPKFPALDMAKNVEDPGARLRMLLGLGGRAAEGGQSRSVSCGRFCPICGTTPPTAFPKFPIRSSKSIAPCGWVSTGSWARSNFGMRPASRPPSPA